MQEDAEVNKNNSQYEGVIWWLKIFFLFSLEFLQLKELSTEKKKQKPDQSKDPTKASKVAKVLEYPDETKTVAIENLEGKCLYKYIKSHDWV